VAGRCESQAFITYSVDIRQILDHIGVDAEPPRITPALGPPLWDGCDAPQVALDFELNQRISWGGDGCFINAAG
jgi:hypothetical protein